MRWLSCTLVSLLICWTVCQTTSDLEQDFTALLYDAAADVLAQSPISRPRYPPPFNMPADFMRSFQPGTGVGNREELVINELRPLPVYEDESFATRFQFKHFNNTDYVAAISDYKMVLYSVNTSGQYLLLDEDHAVFPFDSEFPISDVLLFTRYIKKIESLFVAIATETDKNSVEHVYEIVGNTGVLASVISRSNPVKKMAFVQSMYGGYLAFLTHSANEFGLDHKQQGRRDINHYIDVYYPNPVDLVSFTVHGHGYIAVANRDYCDVFKMDEFAETHVFFERLGPFYGIVDLEYFRLGFQHYLAIVDSDGHHLYTWTKGEFALGQKLPVRDAAQLHVASVESCRDEVLLVTVTAEGEVKFHIFRGQSEKFIATDVAAPAGYLVMPGSVTSYTYEDSVVILLVDISRDHKAFVIKTSLIPLGDPFLVKGKKVSELMKEIQNMIEAQDREIDRIKDVLKDAVRKTGTQHITAVQYFTNLSATVETQVERINEFFVEWENSNLTLEQYRSGTNDLEKNVEHLERLVEDMEKIIPDVVRLDEDAVITGKKIFTGQVSADLLMATSLNLPLVADIDLSRIQREVYRLDKKEFIDGTLIFNEPLTVIENLYVDQTVNGIDISEEVMTTNTEQSTSAEMTFQNKLVITGDLDVYGRVNDIDLSEEVVTLTGKHRITGKKTFLNGIEVDYVQTKYLDGIDIDDLYTRAFTRSGDQTISGDTRFSSVTVNNIVLDGLLNGYDVSELERNIVRVDKPSTISGFKNFVHDVEIIGGITAHGTVNGLKIPDDLVLTDRSQIITGTKQFLGHVIAHDLVVHGTVDGLKIPEDVVTLSADQEISSTLYFADGILAEKNIIVGGLVDSVDISEVVKHAVKLNDSYTFDTVVFTGPVTVSGSLDVEGLVNKVDLKNIVRDIVYRDDQTYEVNAVKRIQTIVADKVDLTGFISGYNISEDFMKVGGSQTITGKVTFKNVVFNSVNVEDGMIGDLNVTDLYEHRLRLIVEEDSVVDNEIEFVDNVVVEGNMIVNGTIGGIRIPEDVVIRNSDETISNKHFIDQVVVDSLIVDGDVNVVEFGGINLTQFYHDRVTLSGDQTIQGDVWIGNSAADMVRISGYVNGIDIVDFAENVMSKTKPQAVTAIKEFGGDVIVSGEIVAKGGVNGYDLADINQRAFKLKQDNVVTAPMEFGENVILTDLLVSGDINGVNMTRLSEDSLKKSAAIQYVTGNVLFHEGFTVTGDVIATKVNGLVIPNDVLLKSIPQTVTGRFTLGNVGLGGDLTVKGTINGLDLSEIAPKLARIDEPETVIESDVTFTSSIHVMEDIEVSGTVNEIDIRDLFNQVLRKTGDQVISGHKVISGNVTILGDIDVKSINGIDWQSFLNDVVWTNVPQVISAHKTFMNDVYVSNDMLVSGVAFVGMINGKDLRKFVEDAVFIDVPTNITGPIVFKNPVEIAGDLNAELINGLRLKTDVITIMCSDDDEPDSLSTNGPQLITGQKTFQKMHVSGDIFTDSVNSYDLLKLYEDTLLTEGDQNVVGKKSVTGEVTFKRNVIPNLVNGLLLSKDLVTLHTEQTIQGPLVFRGDVFVDKNLFVKGLLNGVDLLSLQKEAVYLGTDQVIEGFYSLQNAVVASNVDVNGTVNDMDLKEFDRNVTEFLIDTRSSISIMEQKAVDNCMLAKHLQESLEISYYALDSFVHYQELDFEASFIQVTSEHDVTLVYVDESGSSAVAVQHAWIDNIQKLNVSNFSPTSVSRRYFYRIGRTDVTIAVGINNKESSVVIDSVSPLTSGFSDASVVFKNTNLAIALLFSSEGICQLTYIEAREDKEDYTFDSVNVGKGSASIVLFEVSDVLYLAVSLKFSSSYSSYEERSKIFAKGENIWRQVQSIPTLGPIVKHFFYKGFNYLLFVNNVPEHVRDEPKSVQIYRNTGLNSQFALFQKLPFNDARGIEIFQFGDSSQLHLVAWNATLVQIFGLEGEAGLRGLFSIRGNCVRDVKPLPIGKDLYLLVGQQNLKTSEAAKSILYKGLTKGVKYDSHALDYC